MTLTPQVTLNDVVQSLIKPERYVRAALANMYQAEREYGAVVLRIGRMGTGQIPHYRFDVQEVREAFRLDVEEVRGVIEDPSLVFRPVQAFNGRSHKALVSEGEEVDILRNEHWSEASMNRDEVAELLGKLRSSKRTT